MDDENRKMFLSLDEIIALNRQNHKSGPGSVHSMRSNRSNYSQRSNKSNYSQRSNRSNYSQHSYRSNHSHRSNRSFYSNRSNRSGSRRGQPNQNFWRSYRPFRPQRGQQWRLGPIGRSFSQQSLGHASEGGLQRKGLRNLYSNNLKQRMALSKLKNAVNTLNRIRGGLSPRSLAFTGRTDMGLQYHRGRGGWAHRGYSTPSGVIGDLRSTIQLRRLNMQAKQQHAFNMSRRNALKNNITVNFRNPEAASTPQQQQRKLRRRGLRHLTTVGLSAGGTRGSHQLTQEVLAQFNATMASPNQLVRRNGTVVSIGRRSRGNSVRRSHPSTLNLAVQREIARLQDKPEPSDVDSIYAMSQDAVTIDDALSQHQVLHFHLVPSVTGYSLNSRFASYH